MASAEFDKTRAMDDYRRMSFNKAMMKVRFLAVFIAAIALASCSRAAAPAPAESVVPAGRPARSVVVAFVEGDATIDGVKAEPGDEVALRFIVRTGKESRLDIVFDGGNALSVGQNAIVDFDLSSVAPLIRLELGGVTSVLKKLEKLTASDSFNVQTAHAVMGVRGTSFCVWADATSTYVCACNGEVRTVDARGNNEETLTAAHHVARLYSPKDGTISVEAAGMLHHTDDSVESVASRIGYTIDWTRVDR